MTAEPLKLSARDAEDLAVISTVLQDAITRTRDMAYQERERRFVLLLDRFMWELDDGAPIEGKLHRRVCSALHFDDVLAVQTRDVDMDARDDVIELLAVAAVEDVKASTHVELIFAGGGSIRLNVECIGCRLTDLGNPWVTRRRPDHVVDEAE